MASSVHAEDWATTDKVLLGTALAATSLDWAQTRSIAGDPTHFKELNPFLPLHPSAGQVNTYFACVALGTVGLSLVLPADKRRLLLLGVTVIETGVVLSNHMVGIRLRF